MKKGIFIALLVSLCCSGTMVGQNSGKVQMKEARENLDKEEYVRARYLFIQAYQSLVREQNLQEAVACGVQGAALYTRENLYNEAFDLLRRVEQSVLSGAQSEASRINALRYPITKERMRMYVQMKRAPKAKEQLDRLEELADAAKNDSLESDLLYTKAIYYYTFGNIAQGDAALRSLIAQYSGLKNYNQVKTCYLALIDVGRKANSARMVSRAYDSFISWNDSIQAVSAQAKYNELDNRYQQCLKTIEEKDGSLTTKQYIIVGLGILSAVLAVVLVLGALLLFRFILLTRKQKKENVALDERNRLKTQFVRNITAQMQPALQHLDSGQPAVKAMTQYLQHIQELADLEDSLKEPDEMQERNISVFCERLMDQIRPYVQSEVSLVVHAPKLSVSINEEHLERLLGHLLRNAALHTPAGGKITLEFRKRGAHVHQFLVTDTGAGIPEEKRAKLFLPFTEVKDLMRGDGLGLPICALLAQKMNGSLALDSEYVKGARFVVDLHV